MHISKRKLLAMLGIWPVLQGCAAPIGGGAPVDPQSRFRGIGLQLVVDALPDVDLKGVEFFDDRGRIVFASSTVGKRSRAYMDYPGTRVPLTVRVVWREKDLPISGLDLYGKYNSFTYGGPLAGDYTLPIASRIPDETLADIRAKGGGLRVKFRLQADGVLFGWDIERLDKRLPEFYKPDGDFKEAYIVNGKVVQPGWYRDKNGNKILTDY